MFQYEEIGIGLVGFSILFSFLGVILFFDRGLLALGNIFFLTGVGLLLGWQSMWQLFTKKANLKGSVPFFIGLFLLFVRWPVAGIIMELYGSFVLFSGYGPPIQAFLYQIPIIGWILQYPFQLFAQLRRKRAWNLLQLPRYSLTHHGDKLYAVVMLIKESPGPFTIALKWSFKSCVHMHTLRILIFSRSE